MDNDSEEKDGEKLYEELFAANDPQLRADVISALKAKHGIKNPDPVLLELSLKFGDKSIYDSVHKPDPELLDKLKSAIKESVTELSKEPENARAIVLYRIFDAVWGWQHSRLYYNLPPLSEWQVNNQPDPNTFTDLLEKEDPRFVALMMLNIWGSKQDFAELASVVGNDILSWDDKRSLVYRERKANKPENKNLCDDISVMPARLVAIEPYADIERDFHYDIYGDTIAEVTSFSIHFKPKQGVNPRELQRYVEHAVHRLAEEGEITFRPPTSRYKKPDNVYKRPGAIDESDYKDYWRNFLGFWKMDNPEIVDEFWDFFYVRDEDTGEVFDESSKISGHIIYECLLSGDFPEDIPQKLVGDIKKASDVAESYRYTVINDEGHVVLRNTLILDDVLQLYEFCDAFLTPSVKVAQELESARYAEECGPLISPGDLRDDYSSDHLRLADQLGNFDGVDPEQMVDKGLLDILALYGRGDNAQLAFLQVASLAHGTLTGILPDGTGHFPTLKQIADNSQPDQATALASIAEDNLVERTGELFRRSVTFFGDPNSDLPLQEQFKEAAISTDRLLRYQQKIDDICNHYMQDIEFSRRRGHTSVLDQIINESQSPADLLSEERSYALHCLTRRKRYEPQHSAITILNALEGRSGRDCLWVENGHEESESNSDKNDSKRDPANAFTKETPMPGNLDALNSYIWRCCKEDIFEKVSMSEDAPNFLPDIRANIAVHAGLIPPQLPRDFDRTSYVTRPKGSPFPRPGTDLPEELSDLLPQRPAEDNERIQLPDPSVIWGSKREPS